MTFAAAINSRNGREAHYRELVGKCGWKTALYEWRVIRSGPSPTGGPRLRWTLPLPGGSEVQSLGGIIDHNKSGGLARRSQLSVEG